LLFLSSRLSSRKFLVSPHLISHTNEVVRCFNSRRRRRQGMQPMYGTGWMAKPPPYGHQQGTYAYNGPAAPPYSPPAMGNQRTGNTFNSNEGYYANQHNGYQQNDIELQSPQSAYQPQRGGDPVYDAPMGPPPGKKGDGIIR
jgi:hypothetical protein